MKVAEYVMRLNAQPIEFVAETNLYSTNFRQNYSRIETFRRISAVQAERGLWFYFVYK